jgi:hypothetical protein
MNNAWIEIALALIGGANLYMQLSIKNKFLELELRMNEKFLSKKDFENWTSKSSYLPSFKEKGHYANR